MPQVQPFSSDLHDELDRQFGLLRAEMPIRFLATAFAYGLALSYLHPPFVLALAAISFASEVITYRLFRNIDALSRERWRRNVAVVAIFVIEGCFMLPAAIMWHLDDPYTKALGVGMAAGSMMHLATVRSIHLPQGIAGWLSLSGLIFVSNTLYWVWRGQWDGLIVTTLCAALSLGYFLQVMLATHRLHRDTAAGRRLAMEASAAKDRLLATISHELRTPLNGIVGMAHAERDRAAGAASRERLDLLVASADALAVILDDILDLSAVRQGQLPIRPEAAVPHDVIAQTTAHFAPIADMKGVALSVEVTPDLYDPAVFDKQRLRQCLSNLISNAINHASGASIRVAARRRTDARGVAALEIDVEDDGPGIPPDLWDTAFEPFGRKTALPGTLQAGHGLGLSITRTLARQMGGDAILVPTRSGRGSRFRLSIALYPAVLPPKGESLAMTLPRLDGRRVLVVDDVATNRMVAASYLRLAGAEPVEAASGAAAVSLVEAGGVQAVLLDMYMPGLDGLETLHAIRAIGAPAGCVPVIAMTADTQTPLRDKLEAAGIDGYLSKPMTPESMFREVVRVLDLC